MLAWTLACSNRSAFFLWSWLQTWMQSHESEEAGKNHLPVPAGLFFWCSPGYSWWLHSPEYKWLSGLQVCIASSHPNFYPWEFPCPSLSLSAELLSLLPVCTHVWDLETHTSVWCYGIFHSWEVPWYEQCIFVVMAMEVFLSAHLLTARGRILMTACAFVSSHPCY